MGGGAAAMVVVVLLLFLLFYQCKGAKCGKVSSAQANCMRPPRRELEVEEFAAFT